MSDATHDSWGPVLRWSWVPVLLALAAGGWLTQGHWLPTVQGWIAAARPLPPVAEPDKHAGHDHDHAHAGHEEGNSIELSVQASKNIGLEVVAVELGPYDRSIVVPGMVVERPGRSTINVAAPVTGIVTKIYFLRGEAVRPGERLFDLRLTHEEIVQAQVEFLKTAEEIDVIRREVARLEGVVAQGAVAGKTLLERQYELQLKEAAMRANRQSLLLHGLSAEQVDAIQKTRQLLSEIAVMAPGGTEAMSATSLFQVHKLPVERGVYVQAGQMMAQLTDHSELYIEGNAFEQDAGELQRAADDGVAVSASIEARGAKTETIEKLHILYVAGEVDPETRASHFYMPLANQLRGSPASDQGRRFITWKYRPGQRVQVQIPVEQFRDRIVLPAEAVADDGPETFVFEQNGKHFDRRAVHLEHRDPRSVVIANDGAIFPGDRVAVRGAHQLQLALKNKSGGGIDPHAGHNH